MPNDITSTNHGLSVLTNAAPSHRLGSPLTAKVTVNKKEVDRYITNCFNDATSGDDTPAFSSGHEGLDFACDEGNAVKAMYGGTVTVLNNEFYGLHVKIRPVTDQATTVGFEHLYAHLDSVADKFTGATPATTVEKGEEIGVSGVSGNATGPHLHVHVKPFDASGAPTHEFAPANATDKEILEYPYPPLATRISGAMNFACFRPADHGGPPITFDFLRSFNQLLRARAAAARIPVDREMWSNGPLRPAPALQAASPRLGTLDGSPLGGYVGTGLYPLGPSPAGYQIRWTEPERGWVFQSGTGGAHYGPWVPVEETPGAGARDHPELTLGGAPERPVGAAAPDPGADTSIDLGQGRLRPWLYPQHWGPALWV